MKELSETAIVTKELQIIGAGFGRTGTLSMRAALEELGFAPCYHMTEVFNHPEHVPYWETATRGETINWRELFKGYQAAVDWPACSFYKELMQVYPDAKVLLTVRDPEKWYESTYSTIYQLVNRTHSPSSRLLLKLFLPNLHRTIPMTHKLIWEGTFGGNFTDRHHAIEIFNQHIEEVKQYVPPKQLLVYNVKEGWEPLCTFLGVEIPRDKPFPHLNDRAGFPGNRGWLRRRMTRGRGAPVIGGALFLLLLLFFIFMRIKKSYHI
jgi:hypothetical protein